ncbi:MAG: DnaJ domain-containing protein [Caldilineaceae bacterium]|nr:DnaJ domain-containing protein [Caldilineaceae bacterium]
MKDYYDILDVPLTATPEEIKAQYRQLVRIYHPDRFRDQEDKVYAEEKLKEINIAFQVLSGTAVRREPFEARVGPQPAAYPPHLHFGTVAAGQKITRKLQIGNLGGPAESLNFVYSGERPWFQVGKGRRVYAQKAFPLDFDVTVDTKRLQPGQHQAWLEAVLDGIPVRVGVEVQVVERKQARTARLHWGWTVAGALLALTVLFCFPFLGLSTFDSSSFSLSSGFISARPAYELHEHDMLFSVRENRMPALYVGAGANKMPRRLSIFGTRAAATQVGQRIAYVDQIEERDQIFLFDLSGGEPQQLTHGNAPKSALAWSPDGTKLAYLVGEAKKQQIGVYDILTDQEYLLPGEVVVGVSHFAWSPDGVTLLFDLWQGDERRVFRMDTQGEQLRQLTHFDSWAGIWSADGSQVIVNTEKGLYLFSATGQQLAQLTDITVQTADWSADNAWVAYTTSDVASHTAAPQSESVETDGQTDAAGQTLWLMNRDGEEVRSVAQNALWHQWSPTGATLGYVTGNLESEESLFYLWTLTPDATPQLVAEINEPFFTWPQ